MNKQALVERLAGQFDLPKAQVERMMEYLIETITNALKAGDEVAIAGLGIFKSTMRAARDARNPRTGEKIRVAARRVPKFRPAKALKDAVKG